MDVFTTHTPIASEKHGISFLYADNEDATSVPSQILLFVDFRKLKIPFLENVEGYVGPGTYAVVRCCDGEPRPLRDSVMLPSTKKHNSLTSIPTDYFLDPVCVVDNVGCPNKSVLVLRPRRNWAEEFC
jgi:hypothetical protein